MVPVNWTVEPSATVWSSPTVTIGSTVGNLPVPFHDNTSIV